ncbi:hypothetical protein PFISCL1PPCAC_12933, partial [Pristionchus fissidentatus]
EGIECLWAFPTLMARVENQKVVRHCLICSVPITECHLGIDSCRACAVFYKRICANVSNRPEKCKGGDGACRETDPTTSCRKCRFDRFTDVIANASLTTLSDEEVLEKEDICAPHQTRRAKDIKTTFIDHTSFLLEQPSCSDTPILDKIRWGYSLMCLQRKTGEAATKPVDFHLGQGDYDGSNIQFYPATYSTIVPNARIYSAAIFDFGKLTFPDYAALSEEKRALVMSSCFQHVGLLETIYRSTHYFSDDPDKFFSSYTTTTDEESIRRFFDDCPHPINVQEAIDALQSHTERTKAMNLDEYKRIKPDDVEFLALLGLSFWNNQVAMHEELSEVTERNRAAILRELNIVYKNRGVTDYATRLGELLCLIDNIEVS